MSLSALTKAVETCCFRPRTLTQSVGTKTLSLMYPPQERNHKALDPNFLVGNVSVSCSGLLSGQSDIEADFDPGNFKPPYAHEVELHLG
jgi:hypothetical protein